MQGEFYHNSSFTRESVNKYDDDGRTPLHWAARLNELEKVDTLIKSGADVNLKTQGEDNDDPHLNTALHYAVANAHNSEMVELLLKHGANPDVKNQHRYSPLDYAIIHHRFHPSLYRAIEQLVYAGKPNFFHNNGYTSLHYAIELNDIGLVKFLLEKGADPVLRKNPKEKFMTTKSTLYLAIEKNNKEIFDLLMSDSRVTQDKEIIKNAMGALKRTRNKEIENALRACLK